MTRTQFVRPSVLGDLRAEADTEMLRRAFLETADYRTLLETSDRTVVIGRRGTGKSALALHLAAQWKRENAVTVINVAPEEHQTIGLRPIVSLFGDTFSKMRAGTRIAMRYALMMETALSLSRKYGFSRHIGYTDIQPRVKAWAAGGPDFTSRLRPMMRSSINASVDAETRIGDLAVALEIDHVERSLANACAEGRAEVVFLIDRLDEGYEPDNQGIGLIDGLVQAAIDLKTRIPYIKPVIFLRDNIFRAVQKRDPDYSRTIEGHVLRLHWDVEALFNFLTNRLKVAFQLDVEQSVKIWNRCVSGELKSKEGFSRCLQLTLYRPRDLLSLLNQAFYEAGKQGQHELVLSHVERTARQISQDRLDDLIKEYLAIVPGLEEYIAIFRDRSPELEASQAVRYIEERLAEGSNDSYVQQDFFILESAQAVLQALFSVGVLGLRDSTTGAFVFCHDGRLPDRSFEDVHRVLVHPCYWMALNCTKDTLDIEDAEEIFDEYDIEISSESPAIRNARILDLVRELHSMEVGNDNAAQFETWCHKAIRICFAKSLRHVELKPNKNARSRRDIVATNLGDEGFWRRVREDYATRQVIFEVKNYANLTAADYQQVVSYLTGEYGRLAFVVTRDDAENLYKKRDVEWVREVFQGHNMLVVKLTGTLLAKLLHKLRKPQKHDAVDDSLHRLLNAYTRLYLAGQTQPTTEARKRGRRERTRRRREKRTAAQQLRGPDV